MALSFQSKWKMLRMMACFKQLSKRHSLGLSMLVWMCVAPAPRDNPLCARCGTSFMWRTQCSALCHSRLVLRWFTTRQWTPMLSTSMCLFSGTARQTMCFAVLQKFGAQTLRETLCQWPGSVGCCPLRRQLGTTLLPTTSCSLTWMNRGWTEHKLNHLFT